MSDSLRLTRTIKYTTYYTQCLHPLRSDPGFSGTRTSSPMTRQYMKLKPITVRQYNTTTPALGRMASWHNGPIQPFGLRAHVNGTWLLGGWNSATLACTCIYAPSPYHASVRRTMGLWGKCVRICANRSRTEYNSESPHEGKILKEIIEKKNAGEQSPRSA